VRFAFSDQQLEFRDAVRQVLDKECTTDHLRAAYAAPAARTPRWATLADLGVTGLTVPEDHGGLGLDGLDLVLLLEESGRVALPEPLVETTALAAPLLAGAGREHADAWLAPIAVGGVAAAVGIGPGVTAGIAGAQGADLFLLEATGADGTELHAVPASDVAAEPVPSLDPTRRLATVRWDPRPDTVVASGEDARSAADAVRARAAVATAAQLLGLADRMITLAADYARERTQFGRPIGSFQAVKHLLAGAQVQLEFARPVVYGAAWAGARDAPGAARLASMAKATASDAATEAARVSLQVHGAIGYTWECDLHLFLKRAWALAAAWGDAGHHRSLVLGSLVEDRA